MCSVKTFASQIVSDSADGDVKVCVKSDTSLKLHRGSSGSFVVYKMLLLNFPNKVIYPLPVEILSTDSVIDTSQIFAISGKASGKLTEVL